MTNSPENPNYQSQNEANVPSPKQLALYEINVAEEMMESDLLEEITPENFPNLFKVFEKKFYRIRLKGIKGRISVLYSDFEVVDDEADARVDRDIRKLRKEASEIYRRISAEKPPEEYKRPFTLTPEEVDLLNDAIEGGWVDVLNDESLSLIKRIPEDRFISMLITAYQNAIELEEKIEKKSQPGIAVPGLDKEPSWINKRSNSRIQRLQEELIGLKTRFKLDDSGEKVIEAKNTKKKSLKTSKKKPSKK